MNTSLSVVSKKLSETEFFSFFISDAQDKKFSIALWQLPNDSARHVIISREHQFIKKENPIEDLPTGFIFAPFDKEKDSVYLQADFYFTFENGELKLPQTLLEINSHTWLNEQLKTFDFKNVKRTAVNISSATSTTQSREFADLVQKGINAVEKNNFEKIVLSRTKRITLSENFDIAKSFQKLCNAYPNALVSFVGLPSIGSWLGATPEVLVSITNKTIFKTVALAGTKPYNTEINVKNVAWTQKEIEEQALVERYIISCFKKIRVREYDEHGPKTIIAGNLMHLKSDFTVDMKAINFPQLGSVMLQLLHPTSAVCGMPLEPALKFIRENEGYNREFYSGYLGPINFNNSTNIFVNLRCMQILGKEAIFYAGAGITGDSDPDDEWNETEIKLNTLLNIIT